MQQIHYIVKLATASFAINKLLWAGLWRVAKAAELCSPEHTYSMVKQTDTVGF